MNSEVIGAKNQEFDVEETFVEQIIDLFLPPRTNTTIGISNGEGSQQPGSD